TGGATAAAAAAAPPDQPSSLPGADHELAPDSKSEGMAAYHRAMSAKKLAVPILLSRARLQQELSRIESKVIEGRHDEAIGDLVTIVESPGFAPFKESEEGRAARYLLGHSLGRMGAFQMARGYLVPLLEADPNDTWTRRAVRSLVDLGLNSERPEVFVKDMSKLGRNARRA